MNAPFLHQIRLGPNAVSQALEAVAEFISVQQLGGRGDVIALIVEELMFNLLDHGDAPEGDSVAIELSRTDAGVRLDLVSGGTPFDPRTADHDGPVPDRGGGAGLALVRAWSRVEAYYRIGGRNHLQLLIPLDD